MDNIRNGLSFDDLYLNILKAEQETNRAPQIRGSAVPFCPRRFLLSYSEFLANRGKWSYLGDFYCSIGTSIHQAVQKWLPISSPGYLLGNWHCLRCRKRGERIIVNNSVGPLSCPNCGRQMAYSELTLDFVDAPIIGHCDGVLINKDFVLEWAGKNLNRGQLKKFEKDNVEGINKIIHSKNLQIRIPALVLELKSTGMHVIRTLAKPKMQHTAQATIYVSSLKKILLERFGIETIDVKGSLIKYVSRENPRIRSQDFKKRVTKDTFYDITCKMVNIFIKTLRTLKVKKIYDLFPCKRWPVLYQDCEYDNICAELTKRELKILVKEVREHYPGYEKFNLFG